MGPRAGADGLRVRLTPRHTVSQGGHSADEGLPASCRYLSRMERQPRHPPGRAPRLLLVDGDPEHRDDLRLVLETGGIQVLGAAEDGRQAVALASQLRPDVVVIDMAMSHLDAYEAALLIREAHPWMQVVFLTGHSELFQDDGAGDPTAFACLRRDSVPSAMIEVVQRAWRSGQQIRRDEIQATLAASRTNEAGPGASDDV
jgi:DNA-binding NarL/FixJ family response regulator